ncbi:hypothetical protein Dimus_026793, partial [Dionaea muscipula]
FVLAVVHSKQALVVYCFFCRLPIKTSGIGTHVSPMRLDEDLVMLVQMSVYDGGYVSCGIEVGSAMATGTLFCVFFSDMDVGSAAMIFYAAGSCAALCFISSQRHLTLPDLLVALASELHLTMRELHLNHGGFTVSPAEIDRSSCSSTDVTVTPVDPNPGFIDSFCCRIDSFSLLELISSIMGLPRIAGDGAFGLFLL